MSRLVPILAALTLASAGAVAKMSDADELGVSVQPSSAARTVVIGPKTRWVTVERNDVVRFVSNGQEFAWAFSGVSPSFDLKRIAPSGALDRSLTVYIWPDPNDER